jgi:hypothetical protein
MKKENLVFALYVTVTVVTTVHAGVEIYKTFSSTKEERQYKKAAKKSRQS